MKLYDAVYAVVEPEPPADNIYIRVDTVAELPTAGYDWSEWGLAMVLLEERANGNHIVAYRNETDQVNDDWKVGTLEDAADELESLVEFAKSVVDTDNAQYA